MNKSDDTKIEITLAFIKSHPDKVAAIIEQHSNNDIKNLFKKIPTDYVSLVLNRMMPQQIARIIDSMKAEVILAYLVNLDINMIAATLRYCSKEFKHEMLNLLPKEMAQPCKTLLNYERTLVGAWMKPQINIVAEDSTVEQALHLLLSGDERSYNDFVFIVDRNQNLQGSVFAINLLRSPKESLVQSVTQKKISLVPARSNLITLIDNSLWNRSDVIAVANKNRQLIGMLRHCDFRKGLQQLSTVKDKASRSHVIDEVVKVYGDVLFDLFNIAGNLSSNK